MKRFAKAGRLLAALYCGFAAAADAGYRCDTPSSECAIVGEWQFSLAVGAGIHTNPLVGGDDIPVVLLPRWSYYGERFYVENLELGYSVFENTNQSLHLMLTPGLDHVYFEEWGIGNFGLDSSASGTGSPAMSRDNTDSPQPGFSTGGAGSGDPVSADTVEDRRVAFLAGAGYGLYFGNWSMHAQLVHDANRVHRGEAFRFGLTRAFRNDRHKLGLSGGFVWQSADLLDYYYGLDTDEVAPDSVYVADGGITPFVKLNWERKLSQKWTWETVLNYRRLNDEITASPIVQDDEVFVFFSAARYRF